MTRPDISAHGYSRQQLRFSRGDEHFGQPPSTWEGRLRHPLPLWPFAVAAAFALLIGGQLIVKAANSGIAAIGAGIALGGLGIVWFIFDQLGHRHD